MVNVQRNTYSRKLDDGKIEVIEKVVTEATSFLTIDDLKKRRDGLLQNKLVLLKELKDVEEALQIFGGIINEHEEK